MSKHVDFFSRVDKNGPLPVRCPERGPCWLWRGFINRTGYGQCSPDVCGGGEQRANRASWRFVNGPIPKGVYVLHHCDVRNCVNPSHLYLGTQEQNMKDCFERTKPPRAGESNGRAKLNHL